MISGLPDRIWNERFDCGANRTATNDLAKWANRADFRGSVQVRPALMLDLADPRNFDMVMEDFGGKQVNFGAE